MNIRTDVPVVVLLLFFTAIAAQVNEPKSKCPKPDLASGLADLNDLILSVINYQSQSTIKLTKLDSELKRCSQELTSQLEPHAEELVTTKIEVQSVLDDLQLTAVEVDNLRENLTESSKLLSEVLSSLGKKKNTGSTFVRWGNRRCPNKGDTVYSGIVGGKHYNQKGSGTNALCLTMNPKYDAKPKPTSTGYLYGSEYEGITELQDKEIPCSVCHTPYPTTIMIPATIQCPKGWFHQYNGYLVSAFKDHFASEYLCQDGKPKTVSSANVNQNGYLFYVVVSKCGSLPCPPFTEEQVVTCVVCSEDRKK